MKKYDEEAKTIFFNMYSAIAQMDKEYGDIARGCAIIAVNQVLMSNPTWFVDPMVPTSQYWERVKNFLADNTGEDLITMIGKELNHGN